MRDFRVRTSVRLMQDRVGDHVALDEIARESGLSRPHFYKLFREQVGVHAEHVSQHAAHGDAPSTG